MICQVHFQFFSRQRRTLGARGFFLAAESFGSTAKVTSGELTWPKPEAAHEKSLTKGQSHAKHASMNDIQSVFPNFDSHFGCVYTTPDSSCNGTKIISDRALAHTFIRTVISKNRSRQGYQIYSFCRSQNAECRMQNAK